MFRKTHTLLLFSLGLLLTFVAVESTAVSAPTTSGAGGGRGELSVSSAGVTDNVVTVSGAGTVDVASSSGSGG